MQPQITHLYSTNTNWICTAINNTPSHLMTKLAGNHKSKGYDKILLKHNIALVV